MKTITRNRKKISHIFACNANVEYLKIIEIFYQVSIKVLILENIKTYLCLMKTFIERSYR